MSNELIIPANELNTLPELNTDATAELSVSTISDILSTTDANQSEVSIVTSLLEEVNKDLIKESFEKNKEAVKDIVKEIKEAEKIVLVLKRKLRDRLVELTDV